MKVIFLVCSGESSFEFLVEKTFENRLTQKCYFMHMMYSGVNGFDCDKSLHRGHKRQTNTKR